MQMQQSQQGGFWRFWIWLLIAIVVGYYFFGDFGPERAVLSYTEFKQQVSRGNVSSVTIQEQRVRGSFENEYTRVSNEGADTSTYQAFQTVNPGYENGELMDMLEENNVTVNAESADNNWWIWIMVLVLPWFLIMGWAMYMRNKMMKGMGGGQGGSGGLFNVGKSRARKYQKKSKTGVSFDDVAGLQNAKKDLQEIVQYLKDPKRFIELGAEMPKGVLLMGTPGTGKTLLARAVAGEADVPFFSISGSEFIEMFVGVGASRVRDMFTNAKKEQPAIIFIDELDSIGRSRGAGVGGGHDEREQTLNQILSEMDGFEQHESVVVMAATNRPDILDPALTRPGRFDRQIVLHRPEKDARIKILEIHSRKVPLDNDVDLANVAARTVGFAGADLRNLVNEASLLAGRKEKHKVGMEEFDEAADKVMLGRRQEMKIGDEEKRSIAYHEAGHAIVAKFLPKTDPLQKVTIIPRGRSLGVTQQIPDLDRHNYSREYLVNRIAIAMGGRASERIVFEDYTNGAANDIKNATEIARKMVCQWGMSDRVGPASFTQGEDQVFLGREMAQQKNYSEATGRIIDEEIQRFVNEGENTASQILKEHREVLDAIVENLMEKETLQNSDIDKILEESKEYA
ncbi:MAG: ATP-dependent zinc metalloprotease FtsH [Chitinivibrionales bacterium]